jgi:hypothetical protein
MKPAARPVRCAKCNEFLVALEQTVPGVPGYGDQERIHVCPRCTPGLVLVDVLRGLWRIPK